MGHTRPGGSVQIRADSAVRIYRRAAQFGRAEMLTTHRERDVEDVCECAECEEVEEEGDAAHPELLRGHLGAEHEEDEEEREEGALVEEGRDQAPHLAAGRGVVRDEGGERRAAKEEGQGAHGEHEEDRVPRHEGGPGGPLGEPGERAEGIGGWRER
jgi:hypothetical protein